LYRGSGLFGGELQLSAAQFDSLAGFVFLNGNLHDVSAAMATLAQIAMRRSRTVDNDAPEFQFLVERVLLNRPWAHCDSLANPRGKSRGTKLLRNITGELLASHYPDETARFKARFDLGNL
jgi:hypothetical protein